MVRRLPLFLLPLILIVAAACGGSDAGTNDASNDENDAPPAASDVDAGDSGGAANDLLTSFNPLQLLGTIDPAAASSDEVDPTLEDALLTIGDVPDDYMSVGTFTYSLPTEYGTVDMAAAMFGSGDVLSDDFSGPMVMSAAMQFPPEALAELEEAGGFDEFADLTDEDLDEITGAADDLGFGALFSELSLLDASDLGDGGFGMRMTMDFSGLADMFAELGEPAEEEIPFEAISMDMYFFIDGELALMTFVMWPGDGDAPVDGHDLAEIMDGRAG